MASHPHSILASTVLISAVIVNAIFGLIVLARTYRRLYGWFFAVTMLGVVLWSVGDSLLLFANSYSIVHLGAELFYIAPMIIPMFIWFFSISFPENRRPGILPVFSAIFCFLVLAAVFVADLPIFVKSITLTAGLNVIVPHLPWFYVYALFFSIFFTLTYLTLILKIRRLKGLDKAQVTYTLYGVAGASVPALLTNLSLPIMGHGSLIWLGPSFTLLFAAAVTAAIVRHKLFDIRPVIVRSLGYALTIGVIAAIYGFIVFGIAQFAFDLHFSVGVKATLSLATGLAALSFQGLRKFFDSVTKGLFYRDAYDPQAFFDDFNKILVSTIDLDKLLQGSTETIGFHLKAQYCLVGIKDASMQGYRLKGTLTKTFTEEDIMKVRKITPHLHQAIVMTDELTGEHEHLRRILLKNNIAILARLTPELRLNKEGLGYIVLGPKKSGNPYTSQDVRAIETVANELIIAVQNALRFEEIERFNETLQQRIAEATHRLRETNKKLKMMDETKDDFISMASHQLRTPLTSVKGYLSLVLEGDAGRVTETQRKLLGQAFVSSQRMVFLIADLLNVSRLKSGKFVIESAPINLAELVNGEIDQLVETAQSRGLTLEYHKPKHFPAMNLDETKTRQVIMNFVDNAIYYTPTGGRISVDLKELPQSIELRVTDNGIGVPKHEQHHLFTKFYRAKNAQKARPDGTGLGLFMARKVIVAQGGALIFDSSEGKGSTFGFSFPKTLLSTAASAE